MSTSTPIESEMLYHEIASIGDHFPLNVAIDIKDFKSQVKNYEKDWHRYNPRKTQIQRWGLSLTSLDGGMTGVPDLDSLGEYNAIHKTDYSEINFTQRTSAFENMSSLATPLKSFVPFLGRTHLIRFSKGGFFPYHRDSQMMGANTYRLVALLSESNSEDFVFFYDDKTISLQPGVLYALNTKVEHAVFSFAEDVVILVVNLILKPESVVAVRKHVKS